MDASAVADRLDEELRTGAYADVDPSANGLQVGPGEATVEHVAVAVDAAVATAETALEAGADLLLTHHGVVWGGLDRLTGREYDRVEPLVRAGVPLYVSHLPLDGHPDLGNAAGLAAHLGLEDRGPFGEVGPEHVGRRARAPEPLPRAAVRDRLDALDQGGQSTQVLPFGPETVEDVAVVTGSGADFLREAEAAGVDALVTGEGKGELYHEAREAGVTAFLAGHYATETFGVRRVAALLREWGLEATAIDHPTGL
jgi:dinuclear metal center YbgI/SA1388 family protein